MSPYPIAESTAFWEGVVGKLEAGELFLLVATDDHGVVGTTTLHVSTPPNQPTRAEVAKVLVHRRSRRRGIARRLMLETEAVARREGRTLLVLDTVTGSPAENLYRSLGYVVVGSIPDYAMYPDGRWCPTTILYKQL
jgi:ribosomal protein S18 acetylase RimI-like enzyme